MDSLNLSECGNKSINFKNMGSNTIPIACAFCGSKYYTQCLQQPSCFRIQQPEMNFKQCQEDSINFPQPGFPPYPFIHPIFHSNLFPINSCQFHNNLNNLAKDKENKNSDERGSVPSNQEKNEFREKTTMQDGQKYVSEPESPFSGLNFNSMDPHFNGFLQPNSWGEFIPWMCNTFFASMMSYYFFWNSQKFAANASFKNYAGNSAEPTCSNNKTTNQPQSSETNGNKEFGRKACKRISSTDFKSCSLEEYMEVEDPESREDIKINLDGFSRKEGGDGNTEEFGNLEKEEEGANANCYSICGSEGGDADTKEFRDLEKEEDEKLNSYSICGSEGGNEDTEFGNLDNEEGLEYVKTSSDSIIGGEDEDPETEGYDSVFQVESNDNFKTFGKDLNTQISSENQLVMESEMSYLLAQEGSDNTVNTAASQIQINSSDAFEAEEDNVFLPGKDNYKRKPNLATERGRYQERMCFKKAFKNFTLADQTNDNFLNKTQISVAAAGDLGGENCVGYKVTIVPFEKEEVLQETLPLEFQLKDLEPQDNRNVQKKISCVKNTTETSKNTQNSKSRIAKLFNNVKSKELKSETIKNSKQNKPSNQKEETVSRRKHSCLSSSKNNNNNDDNNNNVVSANEKTLKIQKTRNYIMAEEQTQGPKKHSKEINLKNNVNKSEKKFQRLKF